MRRLPGSAGGDVCGGFQPLLAALLALSSASASASAHVDGTPPSKIAVVGAGIGGSAAAHFLRQHFGADVQLDVYEKGEVGGRLATVTVNRDRYESGGAVVHSLNLHMRDFVKQLGLKYRRGVAGKTAVFDGAEVILGETDWYLLDLFRLWWRYGISFIRLQMWVEEIMEKFVRIYKYQAHGYAFSSAEDLLDSLGGSGFLNMTRRPLSDSLLELGVSQRFIDEVVAPVIRLDYGQNVSIPAFVGAVSLASAHSNLWAVEGGNKLVCEGLLKMANANLVPARVTSVRPLRSAGGALQYQLSVAGEAAGPAYDAVVLAAPLRAGSGVSFRGFAPPVEPAEDDDRGTVATVVHGYLNTSLFGFPDPRLFPYAGVLTTDAPALFFNSVAAIYPVNVSLGFRRKRAHEAAVYKVFSPEVLTREQLKTLFRSYYSAQATEQRAYPRYGDAAPPPVELRPHLYYLNGVERAGGAVEMSAVAAKNVALLAYHRWNGRTLQVDRKDLMHKIKTEL